MEMRKIFAGAAGAALWLLASCGGGEPALRDGDLLFQTAGGSDFSTAIAAATAADSLAYDHVGIVHITAEGPCVVEATPRRGVKLTPLDSFLSEGPAVGMRFDVSDIAAAAPARAMRLLGRPYDWRFAPGDQAVYCSELVQIAYLDSAGRPVFPSAPMNFLDSAGRLPRFWRELYDSLGCAVPQGAPGTNPTAIARDSRLREVWRNF